MVDTSTRKCPVSKRTQPCRLVKSNTPGLGFSRRVKKMRSGSSLDTIDTTKSFDNSQPATYGYNTEITIKSNISKVAIHPLLVEWKQRGLDREKHQDPDQSRCTSNEDGIIEDNFADKVQKISVCKQPTRLFPHSTVVRTNLERLERLEQ